MKQIIDFSKVLPFGVWTAIASLALFAGCSSLSSSFSSDKVDYKNSKSGPSLDVPPDLSLLVPSEHKVLSSNAATLSAYEKKMQIKSMQPVDMVLPSVPGMKVMRDGNQRWLVIQKAPNQLWEMLREFWQENGFILILDSSNTGVIETDWAENRAKLDQDIIRNLLGKVFDGLYSTGERDRFRMRVERETDGSIAIYISHRRMVEVFTSDQRDTTKWQPAPSDFGLEAIFLTKLMQHLGMQAYQAKTEMEMAKSERLSSIQVVNDASATYIDMSEPFDQAWRRVGIALDRCNFTVDSRDRAKALYWISYVDSMMLSKDNSFFYNLFHAKEVKERKKAKKYGVNIQGQGDNKTRVQVLDDEGKVDNSIIAQGIIGLLNDHLR
ncbi:outer membrane protein assembly factor BamC [Candidatus Pandoraea novymonadis]|uniref:Outer membrane protein assembly factor BamC n=1 Tax=Candidatus Pandoraea novymonadis TaxID=1808959 RepID=A0ABX5FET3_9BURK|nr:outer membrane protein assembly factor BamC [Candidatus Pandoraea novymonadis]PSB92210.1 Outer membrane protein assembly factor BamC [Candidatus Pandoraea novymonadis]